MNALRHHLLRRRRVAAWIVAAAVLMKLLVPAGFMPVFSSGGVTITLCTGDGPQPMTMAMPGMADHAKTKGGHGDRAQPCGFGGLAFPSLAAADPILLAIAIAFIVATIARRAPERVAGRVEHLRPFLRGPPAAA